jgi:hypothetical protein
MDLARVEMTLPQLAALAATAHTAKATTRAAVNTSPEPFPNIGLARRGGRGRTGHGPPPKRPQAAVCGKRPQSAASRQTLLRRSSEAHWSP